MALLLRLFLVRPKRTIFPAHALCAIWQTVKADAHGCPPFSVGNAAGRGEGTSPSIHPMDFDFHPMDRPFHPMEISIDGHFLGENSLRFAPYSGKKGPRCGVCGRALRVYASASGGSDFRPDAPVGALGRKYSILRVKNERSGRFLSSSGAGCGGGHGYFNASSTLRASSMPFSTARRSQYSARPSSCVTPSP